MSEVIKMNYKRLVTTVMTAAMTAALVFPFAAAGEVNAKEAATQVVQEAKTEDSSEVKSEETKASTENKSEDAQVENTEAVKSSEETSDNQKVKTETTDSSTDTKTEGNQEVKSETTDSSTEVKTETDSEEKKSEGTATEGATESEKTDEQVTEDAKASSKDAAEAKEKTSETTDAQEAKLALQNDPNHVHKFEWIAIMNENEAAEGTNNYMCEECGKIWYFSPIPAYLAFTGSTAHKIMTAPQGGTVNISTSHFISFNNEVMDALVERPDVSLYVSFLDQEYKGNRVSFVIPAGEKATALLDQNGYAGFLFIGGKYGLTMEVPMEVDETTVTEIAEEKTADTEAVSKSAEASTVDKAADETTDVTEADADTKNVNEASATTTENNTLNDTVVSEVHQL